MENKINVYAFVEFVEREINFNCNEKKKTFHVEVFQPSTSECEKSFFSFKYYFMENLHKNFPHFESRIAISFRRLILSFSFCFLLPD